MSQEGDQLMDPAQKADVLTKLLSELSRDEINARAAKNFKGITEFSNVDSGSIAFASMPAQDDKMQAFSQEELERVIEEGMRVSSQHTRSLWRIAVACLLKKALHSANNLGPISHCCTC